MHRRFLASLLLLFLLFAATLNVSAQEQSNTLTRKEGESSFVASLLGGPDRSDMPWKVHFFDPRLMYQQMYLVQVRARVPAEILDRPGKPPVLHFVVKVQNSKGEWLPGEEYNRFEPTAELGKSKEIECALAIYLRPGEYTVAMIAFESTRKQANILRKRIVIPELRGDPLPELDAHLPIAEFPDDFPQEELSFERPSEGELFPVAGQVSPLLISNSQPTRIDVVINISKQPDLRRQEPEIDRRRPRGFERSISSPPSSANLEQIMLGSVLQSGSVLSRLSLARGCVYVSVVDPLRMRVIQEPKLSNEINWREFQKSMMKLDQNTIDARVLQNHNGPGVFLRDFLDRLSAASDCDNSQSAVHSIAVLGSDLPLPEFNQEMRISEASAERARFYYFHAPALIATYDKLGDMLKPARPKRLEFNNPAEFRKDLARFLADIRSSPSK
jgi:hypothetical protein